MQTKSGWKLVESDLRENVEGIVEKEDKKFKFPRLTGRWDTDQNLG